MANPRSLRQLKLVYYTLREKGRGHWIVNYAGTKSSQNIISRSLVYKLLFLLLNLDPYIFKCYVQIIGEKIVEKRQTKFRETAVYVMIDGSATFFTD